METGCCSQREIRDCERDEKRYQKLSCRHQGTGYEHNGGTL